MKLSGREGIGRNDKQQCTVEIRYDLTIPATIGRHMNSALSSLIFHFAGLFLMIGGANQMLVKAQSESEGITGGNLIAENVRSNGYQSFGIGMACIALGSVPGRKQEVNDNRESIQPRISQKPATSEIPRMLGQFKESEWDQILQLADDAGIDKREAVAKQSYMTSSNTAVICDKNKMILAEILRTSTGEWKINQ